MKLTIIKTAYSFRETARLYQQIAVCFMRPRCLLSDNELQQERMMCNAGRINRVRNKSQNIR
jgi:hypothetical protein